MAVKEIYAETCKILAPKNLAKMQEKLGKLYYEQGDWKASAHAFQQAIILDDSRPDAYLFLGQLMGEMGFSTPGKNLVKESIQRNRFNASAYYVLGNFEADQSQWELALKHYRRAFQLDSEQAGICTRLGFVLATLGQVPEALEMFELALNKDSNDDAARYYLGWLLLWLGKRKEARKHLRLLGEKSSPYALKLSACFKTLRA